MKASQNFIKSEQDISSLLKWATGLAIFISCMGLLGLVMYTTNLRNKEIGVRKVFGASVMPYRFHFIKGFSSPCLDRLSDRDTAFLVGNE